MRTYLQAKAMAKSLRDALTKINVALSHSQCLEIVAKQFGFGDWNTLSSKIDLETGARKPPPESPGIQMQSAIPILRIFSVEKAKEFYVEFLGFSFDWSDGDEGGRPLYAQVSRSGTTLHLSEHHGDASPGTTAYIRMVGIEAFHRELSEKEYRYARPGINQTPHDTREVSVIDPFGNRLRFSENNPPGVSSAGL